MSDEVMQDLDRMVRVGLTTAGQLGEQLRRRAADADRRARDAAVDEQRAAAERVRAIREEARSHYAKVGWADWQDQATLTDWATAYQVAHQMRGQDPVAAAAHDRIEAEVQRRYNVDIREALQLHLQQVAEDQRIRSERDRDTSLDEQTATAGVTTDPAQATDATVEAGADAHLADDPTVDPPLADPSADQPVVIPGQVVSDAEMAEAQAAAKTAAQGFDQTGSAALRQHRTTLRSRLRRPAKRDTHTITAARRRGR